MYIVAVVFESSQTEAKGQTREYTSRKKRIISDRSTKNDGINQPAERQEPRQEPAKAVYQLTLQ